MNHIDILLTGIDQSIAAAASELTQARQTEPVRFALSSIESASALLDTLRHHLTEPAADPAADPAANPTCTATSHTETQPPTSNS